MARSQSSDPLLNFRFHVDATGIGGVQKLAVPGRPSAGFVSCSVPAPTTAVATYKEGNFVYERKYPGATTFADITLTRGVIRNESIFWNWMLQVIEGSGEYRADVAIKHFHRDTSLLGVEPVRPQGTPNFTQLNFDNPAFTYQLFEAFPVTTKLSGDLSSTAADVSMAELTLAYEFCNVVESPPA